MFTDRYHFPWACKGAWFATPRFFGKGAMGKRAAVCMILLCTATGLGATGVYQEPADFVAEAFAQDPPAPRALWIKRSLRAPIEEILGHPLGVMRLRYWQKDGRSAWVIDEIGKEEPITTGVVIKDGRIERVKILVFRESRGWEVRHDFFTDQFKTASIDGDYGLDRNIDGVSGATLSVRAVTRLARLALFLSQHVAAGGGL